MALRNFIYSFIHSFVHPFIHSFNHSFIHSFIHWFVNSYVQVGCLHVRQLKPWPWKTCSRLILELPMNSSLKTRNQKWRLWSAITYDKLSIFCRYVVINVLTTSYWCSSGKLRHKWQAVYALHVIIMMYNKQSIFCKWVETQVTSCLCPSCE